MVPLLGQKLAVLPVATAQNVMHAHSYRKGSDITAKFRTISTSFWENPQIFDDFSIEERYLLLYLLTAPSGNLCGCFELGSWQISRHTGFDYFKIPDLIDALVQKRVIEYCEKTKEVRICSWIRNNFTGSKHWLNRAKKEAGKIKSNDFRCKLLAELQKIEEKHFTSDDSVSGVKHHLPAFKL